MGMFDIVNVPCPKCGKLNQFQSKSGYCNLNEFTLQNCPKIVLQDVNRHAPYTCECGTSYKVDIPNRKPLKSKR